MHASRVVLLLPFRGGVGNCGKETSFSVERQRKDSNKMKRLIVCAVSVAAMFAMAAQEPRRVVLFVENKASSGLQIPAESLTAGFRATMASNGFQVIDPYDGDPVRTDATRRLGTEALRTESPIDIARRKMAHGFVKVSILSLDVSQSHMPHSDYVTYNARITFTLVDTWSEASICSNNPELPIRASRQYNLAERNDPEKQRQEQRQHLEELLFSSGVKCARELLQNPELAKWKPLQHRAGKWWERDPEFRKWIESIVDKKLAEKKPVPPPPKALPDKLTIKVLDEAVDKLFDEMLAHRRFRDEYANVKAATNRAPLVVVRRMEDKTIGNGGIENPPNLFDSASARVRIKLYDAAPTFSFKLKSDEDAVRVAQRIISGRNGGWENDEGLKKDYVGVQSPDFYLISDLSCLEANRFRLRMAIYDLKSQEVFWEGTHDIELAQR